VLVNRDGEKYYYGYPLNKEYSKTLKGYVGQNSGNDCGWAGKIRYCWFDRQLTMEENKGVLGIWGRRTWEELKNDKTFEE
jgi:hypothetical protein